MVLKRLFQGLLLLLRAAYARLGLTGQDQVKIDSSWTDAQQ